MKDKNRIIVEQPKPFEKLEDGFTVSGWVPKSWLDKDSNILLKYYLLNLDGGILMGCDIYYDKKKIIEQDGRFQFSDEVKLDHVAIEWISKVQGLTVIEFKGQDLYERFYIPVTINGFTSVDKIDPEIHKKHRQLGELKLNYYKNLKIYDNKFRKITKDNIHKYNTKNEWKSDIIINVTNEKVASKIVTGLKADEKLSIVLYDRAKQSREESLLNQEYQDVIEVKGTAYKSALLWLVLAKYLVGIVITWTIGHILEDLDDKLWNNVKSLSLQAFISAKQYSGRNKFILILKKIKNAIQNIKYLGKKNEKKRDQIALLIETNRSNRLVFIFDTSLSIAEFEDAFSKIIIVLRSLTDSDLENIRLFLSFRFNNLSKEWEKLNEYKN
jgi:hypothetical protein